MATLGKTKQIQNDYQKALNSGYNPSNYQKGWGIGDSSNISMGFNSWNDANAIRNELSRVNTVMRNRNNFGLGNTQYQSYYDKLNSAIAPQTQAQQRASQAQSDYNTRASQNQANYQNQFNNFNNQITNARDDYYNGDAYRNYERMMDATIDDIARKYNFDFSREYANRQAEAEAQALRDANADAQRRNKSQNELNLATIDANLMNMAEALDRNYFQQMLGQQQNQVNSGLNAGIAADQDLRLQMARQAEMGGAYRDANLGIMQENQRFTNDDLRLAEALGTINQQAQARAEALYNERLMQGYDMLSNDRNYALDAANMEWGQASDLVNQYLNQQNMLTNNYQWQSGMDYNAMRDIIGDTQFDQELFQRQLEQSAANQQWLDQFQYQQQRDRVGDRQWQQQFNWGKLMDEAGLTGNYKGGRTLQGQQFDWNKVLDEAGLTGLFNGQKTWDRQLQEAELALQRASLNASRYSGGGGSGGSSSRSSSSQGSLGNAYQQFLNEKNSTPTTPADEYYMQQLARLGKTGTANYVNTKTNKVKNKTITDKFVEALGDGVIAPPTTTNLDRLQNLWNVTRR